MNDLTVLLRNKQDIAQRLMLMACVFLPCYTVDVTADEYHYNNILIGDRASGIGGAYVAIADDPAGLYYNPAGIVHSIGSNISGSMNAYHSITTTYKNALGGKYDWVRESAVLAPNFFGVFQPLADGKFGLSYAVVDTVFEDQDRELDDISDVVSNYVINFNNQDSTYNVGPSYGFDINDDLSAGFTLYWHTRTQENINNQIITLDTSTNYEWSNIYEYNEETGMRPIFGIMWSPREKISLGMTISKTILFESKHVIQSTCKSADVDGTPSCSQAPDLRRTVNYETERDHPLQISVGIAYFKDERSLYSADLSYYSSTDSTYEAGRLSVLNIALGSEYYFNPSWAIRGGFYTNFANTPELKTSGLKANELQEPHVDMYGVSFSISHFNSNSVLSLGINTMFGSGKAQLFQATGGTATLQDVEINTLTVFLSATSSY